MISHWSSVFAHHPPLNILVFRAAILVCLWGGGTIAFFTCSSQMQTDSTLEIVAQCVGTAVMGSIVGSVFGVVAGIGILAVVRLEERRHGDLANALTKAKWVIQLAELVPSMGVMLVAFAVLLPYSFSPLVILVGIAGPTFALYGIVERWQQRNNN
jgi:hypothetical protein